MKERPILFNSEMVKAILDGRKTQTRRVIKPQPLPHQPVTKVADYHTGAPAQGLAYYWRESGYWNSSDPFFCPFGQVGDRLWVRETFWEAGNWDRAWPEDDEWSKWTGSRRLHYAADGNPPNEPNRHYPEGLQGGTFSAAEPDKIWRKFPSIHMPRWASRITLEVTGIRVERITEITEDNAKAEGAVLTGEAASLREAFAYQWMDFYWDAIELPWFSNPWVWVIEFKKV